MLCIRSPGLVHLLVASLYPYTKSPKLPCPSAPDNHYSTLWFYKFSFLDFTYEWYRTVFVFLCPIYFNILHSRSTCVVGNGRMSFIITEIYTTSSSFIHSLLLLLLLSSFTSVVSDSVRPHRRQPTRLPRPWDSPGKNTGVCCHCLLQCMKVKSESEVAQSCPTLRDPMDCSLPGSSIHGIF